MIKLKGILNEARLPQPTDDTDVDEYVWDFQKYVVQELPKLNGWQSNMDSHSGAIEWFRKDKDSAFIYATPMWEGEPFVPVDINIGGDPIYFKKSNSYQHMIEIKTLISIEK